MTGPIGVLPPSLPDHCVLEVDEKGSEKPIWRVTSGGKVSAEHKEEDLRLSVSCKFHMFRSEEEKDEFYEGREEKLSAKKMIDGLVEELGKRGQLPTKLSKESPLYELAPLLVQHFVLPFAPNSEEIKEMWK